MLENALHSLQDPTVTHLTEIATQHNTIFLGMHIYCGTPFHMVWFK